MLDLGVGRWLWANGRRVSPRVAFERRGEERDQKSASSGSAA
jgi:hypothetical protein